ncbi:MAG: efflux RND transporter permease subunit [Bacteroidales bacterium]
MWSVVVRIILRNRITILAIIFALTGFMAWQGTLLEMDYEMVQMLPEDNPTSREYAEFKQLFGADASMMVIGMQDDRIRELKYFQRFYDFTEEINSIAGVDTVLSISKIYSIKKDEKQRKMKLVNIVEKRPETQQDVDTVLRRINDLKFYHGFLFEQSKGGLVHMMAITLNQDILNSKGRIAFVKEVEEVASKFTEDTGIELHYSGMPYIRSQIMAKVKGEVTIFILLAALVLAIILYLFFRSFRVVAASLLIVGIAVVWVLGTMHLLGFKITILTAMIPPLIIVIGIPNCIYLLNKYHQEFKNHGNKIKALSRVVQRVGNATLMTNMTTAVGFATFIIVKSDVLKEFGMVASLNIMGLYLLSLTLITIIFSYLPDPTTKHVKHLENIFFRKMVSRLVRIAIDQRKWVYWGTALILLITGIGIVMINTTGNVVDDISEHDPVYKDLMFFEKHFTGVLPFELKIDTKEEDGVFSNNGRTLYQISRFYREIQNNKQFSEVLSAPLSVIDGISFLNQANNGGDPHHYLVPAATDLAELKRYLSKDSLNTNAFKPYIDSTRRYTRISLRMANIGSKQIREIKDSLEPLIARVFNPPRWHNSFFEEEESISTLTEAFEEGGNMDVEARTNGEVPSFTAEEWRAFTREKKDSVIALYQLPDLYKVVPTGMAVVFLEGTRFLLHNLFQSLGLAILLIAGFMVWLFRSFRMVIISLIPNIIPLLFTAAIMGYTGIPIKPSTILVFSIAFGISVDNAIHFLAKFRQELRLCKGNRRKSVVLALRETGFSMMYTSITLFFGFSIFIASGFGGTQAMGILVSLTLLLAMFTNLLLLPSLILTLERLIETKQLKKARIQIYDDEDASSAEELEPELKKLIRRRRRKANRN